MYLFPQRKHQEFYFALLTVWESSAIAQTTIQQPTPSTPPPSPDPLTTYGVLAALLLSSGSVFVNLFKSYVATLGKRSEIELKAQESQEQRNQDIAVMVMRQQEALVLHLQTSQEKSSQELMKLFKDSIEAQHKMSASIDLLTEQLRSEK